MNYDSESSDATILSSFEEIDESAADNCEIAKILDLKIQLPQDLCENREIFQELFSLSTWNTLTTKEKEHLSTFLPQFPECNEQERSSTVQQLFSNKITRFGTSPLSTFHNNLQDGNYRPDIAAYRKQIMKAEEREQRIRMCERISLLAEKLVMSREKLLRSVYSSCPEVLNAQSIPKQLSTMVAIRGSKRYAQELTLIKAADNTSLMDDKSSLKATKKQIKQLEEMDKLHFDSEFKITSTTSNRQKRLNQIVDTNISNEKYNHMLASYKKRKEIEPEHAEMEFDKINLKDIVDRSSLPLNAKKLSFNLNNSLQSKKSYMASSSKNSMLINLKPFAGKKQKMEFQEKYSESDEDSWTKGNAAQSRKDLKQTPTRVSPQKAPTLLDNRKRTNEDKNVLHAKKIVIDAAGKLKVLAAKGSKISQIDKKKSVYSQSPDSINNNDSCESAESSPELKYETQNCFLSLIRDIFCSTCDHRMKLEELRRRINVWLKNPVAPMNSWYKEIDHWENLLTSAVLFLSGEFQYQPEDFVPYLEFKSNLNIYQWIGAGRDSDMRMLNLYKYWLSRHNEMGIRASNITKNRILTKTLIKDEQTIIPIRQKSDWKVRPATEIELLEYHSQERKRYENPNAPFTYRQHGYDSIVGPIKQSSLITNTRNDILMSERAKYITTSNLVLDAIARLPNGEGTCSDICELLKYSQYLVLNLNENVLQSAVNTILETLNSEALNPSVRFDNKRKLWIYLHRNYTEEDFKEMQLKQRKKIFRKIDTVESSEMRPVMNRPSISLAKTTKPNMIINVPSIDSKINTLKTLPKQFITKTINSPAEPFDAEASLDAHTMPIVRTTTIDNKIQQRVMIKTTAQNSPPLKLSPAKNSPNIKGNIIINKSGSPKISTIIGTKKVNERSIVVSNSKVPPLITKAVTTTTSSDGQNYLIALNVNPQNKQTEPPALCATSPSSTIQHKNVLKINPGAEKSVLTSQQTPKYILSTSSLPKTGKLLTIPRNSTPMLSQQKQILTNVIVEQQKAKSEQNQIILTPSSSNQSTPTKLIQIQQPTTLNINSPQQQVFHLKQLKQEGGQQTMILKPQIIKSVTSSSGDTPTLVSVNKIIKSTTSPLTKASLVTTTAASSKSSSEIPSTSPIVARVISTGGRQIIDGSSLPKGTTTFKVAGANSTLPHGIIQIAGNSNCSIITKGKNIVSMTPTQTKAGLVTSSVASMAVTKTSPIMTASTSTNDTNSSQQQQQQPLKIVQNNPITTQQLLNAKLINVQGKNIKAAGGIKMINSQGYITNIGNKAGIPIILATGKGTNNASTTNDDQRIILQADSSQTSGFVINNSTQNALKLQDNVLTQQQTVVIGNQVLKLQPLNQLQGQKVTKSTSAQPMVISTSSCETSKVELAGTIMNQSKKVVTSTTTSAGSNQQIIFGSNFKVLKNMIKTTTQQSPATTTRIVLAPSATQSGQQIAILPANFQGIKTLQGIKVIQQGRIVASEKKPTTSPGSKDELSK